MIQGIRSSRYTGFFIKPISGELEVLTGGMYGDPFLMIFAAASRVTSVHYLSMSLTRAINLRNLRAPKVALYK